MSIKAKLIIDLPDGVDYDQHIENIKNQMSRVNGLNTIVSVQEIDDPITLSKRNIKQISEVND